MCFFIGILQTVETFVSIEVYIVFLFGYMIWITRSELKKFLVFEKLQTDSKKQERKNFSDGKDRLSYKHLHFKVTLSAKNT